MVMKVELNSDGKGIRIAQQAITVTTDAIVARLCTLLEAAMQNETQCNATKKTLKGIIREENNRMHSYLHMRKNCDLENKGIPDSYAREVVGLTI